MTPNLRGIGWSGFAVVVGAGLAWACASGGTDDTNPPPDGGVETIDGSGQDAFGLGDATPATPGGDSGQAPGDDDTGAPTGDDDSGSTGDDDSGSTGDDSGGGDDSGQPPVDAGHDAGHDAGQTDGGCGSVAVVINEVQTTGVSSTSDEWVELFNPSSTCPVDISGWKLKYLASTGTSPSAIWTAPASTTLAALGYGVAAGTAYTGSATPLSPALSNGLAEAGGGVGLYDANGTLLDSVGYGNATNTYIETAAAGEATAGQSIARIPNGTDTNDNATNFAIASTPTPGAKN